MYLRRNMTRFPPTLAVGLTLWYTGIFVLFTGGAFLLFYFTIDTLLDQRIDEDLEEDIVEFRNLYREDGIEGIKTEIQRELQSESANEIFLRLLDRNGSELYASDMSHWRSRLTDISFLASLTITSDSRLETLHAEADDYPARVITFLISPNIILQIGESTEEKAEFMELLLGIFPATFLIVTLFAAVVGWLMALKAMHSVEEVSQAAEDVANGTLDRRVTVQTKGKEIARLVNTFNTMIDRIHALVSGLRDITDNIAHDLRGPVARIRANAELPLSHKSTDEEYGTSAADIIEECDRMMEMINTTLDVTEAETGAAVFAEDEIDLTALVEVACELFEPVAEDRNIQMSTSIANNVCIRGNMQQLQRMLANLLDNALKYTPAGGRVETGISVENGTISLTVSDNGIGISEVNQAHIFDRSFRCGESRSESGFGLGLSLARAVARSHGGDITVSSIPDKGSTFTVTLQNSHKHPD